MDSTRNRLFFASLLLAILFLLIGYALSSLWWIVPIFLGIIFLVPILKRTGWRGLSAALLLFYITGATAGIILGVSPAVLTAGVASGLISWGLFESSNHGSNDKAQPLGYLYEAQRNRILVISVVSGAVLAEIGLLIRFSLPFWVMLLAGLLVLFSLYRFFKVINAAEK